MRENIFTVNVCNKSEEESTTIFTTTDVDKLDDFVRDNPELYENEYVYIYIWEDGIISKAYTITDSCYDQALENINSIYKERGCDFCRNNGVKLTANVQYWDLPEDTRGISANLVFDNMGNEAVLSVESNYKDTCYITHGYPSNIINIQYCPVCGRKLIP